MGQRVDASGSTFNAAGRDIITVHNQLHFGVPNHNQRERINIGGLDPQVH